MKKKFMAALLAFAFIFTLCPTVFFAEEEVPAMNIVAVQKNDEAYIFEISLKGENLTGKQSAALSFNEKAFDFNAKDYKLEILEDEWKATVTEPQDGFIVINVTTDETVDYDELTPVLTFELALINQDSINSNSIFLVSQSKIRSLGVPAPSLMTTAEKTYHYPSATKEKHDFTLTFNKPVVVTGEIKSVNITVKAPVAGENIPALKDVTTEKDAKYTVKSIKWYVGSKEVSAKTFDENTKYTAEIVLTVMGKATFEKTTANAISKISPETEISKDKKTLTLTYEFDKTGVFKKDPTIKTVTLSDKSLTSEGGDILVSVTLDNDDGKQNVWIEHDEMSAKKAKFNSKTGKYELEITFPENTSTKNDKKYTIYVCIDDGDYYSPKPVVTVAKKAVTESSECDILSFEIEGQIGETIINKTAKTVYIAVPSDFSVKTVIPTIVVSDKATVSPASGKRQDFTNDIKYTVTAEDGTKKVYTVTVEKISEPEITGITVNATKFSYTGSNHILNVKVTTANTSETDSVVVYLDGTAINATATRKSSGVYEATLTIPENTSQAAKKYTLKADLNNDESAYTKEITVYSEKESIAKITSVKADGQEHSSLKNKLFTITMPWDFNLSRVTVNSISFEGDYIEYKREDDSDYIKFNSSFKAYIGETVLLRVTSVDGESSVVYTLEIEKEAAPLSSEKDIISFIAGNYRGTINESKRTILVEVDSDTNIKKLKTSIVVSDKADVYPESGKETNFTNPVVYTVTAEDGSTKTYTVTVVRKTSPEITGIYLNGKTETLLMNSTGGTVKITVTGKNLDKATGVTIRFNGKNYTAALNKNGEYQIIVQVPSTAGEYTVSAKADNGESFYGSSVLVAKRIDAVTLKTENAGKLKSQTVSLPKGLYEGDLIELPIKLDDTKTAYDLNYFSLNELDDEYFFLDGNGNVLFLVDDYIETNRKITIEYRLIKLAVEPTSISFDKTSITIYSDETYDLSKILTIKPSNATELDLTYTSSDKIIATVSQTGWVTANTVGTTKITVKTENGLTATLTVNVQSKTVPVVGVLISKSKLSLEVGESETLIATILPANATNPAYMWYSSDTSIAKVANGKITAVKAGSAIIYVQSLENGKMAQCVVTVTEPEPEIISVTSVTLNKSNFTLEVGDNFTLKATIKPSNATDTNVTWESDDTSVLTVKDGVVTAKKAGVATVTATVDGKTDYCTITVRKTEEPTEPNEAKYIKDLKLEFISDYELEVGKTYRAKLTLDTNIPEDDLDIEWSITPSGIATIKKVTGKPLYVDVTISQTGAAVVSVDVNGKLAILVVLVESKTVENPKTCDD